MPDLFFPIPPEILARACETVSARVSQLPFLRGGVLVSEDTVRTCMECLNAVPAKTLVLITPAAGAGDAGDGLDRCLEKRLHIPGRTAAPIISEVLCSAGIGEPARVMDHRLRREHRGMRLVPPWTWHIASEIPPSFKSAGSDPARSWLNTCPVCRTGILSRITGKQLFGIPHTDYYIECSSCGAKFIPVGPAFRLVSIAAIRDPLWKRDLNKTRTSEEWSLIAQKGGSGNTLRPGRGPAGRRGPAMAGDGSLAVTAGEKTLYFRPVKLLFSGPQREAIYSRIQMPLQQLMDNPLYARLQTPVRTKYSRYLPLRAGIFLSHLRERHDPFYREFLNPYGDERYCTIRADDPAGTERKGVLLLVGGEARYAFDCSRSIPALIDERFGQVRPTDCLISGDPDRCRFNTLLCTSRRESGLFAYPAENPEERQSILKALQP